MTQLDLKIKRELEPDRNFDKGGRSFYFFDLDDNVFYLSTPIYLFHKETQEELIISSGELAQLNETIGHSGVLKDYAFNFHDHTGTFRRFRDVTESTLQPFIQDLQDAIQKSQEWKGPSWECFYHAAFNQRPMSLITARGHHPDTIKLGIREFVKSGHLPAIPNFLSVYPVSHPETRDKLSGGAVLTTAELKLRAVIESVEAAMDAYGYNPHHRFGMSDDDPKNLEMIYKAMLILKNKYPENSFFVIHTKDSECVKEEVFLDHIQTQIIKTIQPTLF